MLTWSNLAKFKKMLREAHRPEIPREIGPVVSTREAMERLGRSRTFVDRAIREGILNAWQDPITRRRWVLLGDLEDLIRKDAPRLAAQHARQGGKPVNAPSASDNPQSEIRNLQSDDVKPFSHDTYGAAGALDDWERESERRYQARLAELDAELAALRAELGLEEEDNETVTQGDKETPAALQPTTAPAPAQSAIRNPQSAIEAPFPIGWVPAKTAAAMLDVSRSRLVAFAQAGKLQRRKLSGRRAWLYDTVEVAALAEQRLAAAPRPRPGKRLNVWGSRAKPIELSEWDLWITPADAAIMLRVGRNAIYGLCDRGLLPCKQAEPGKRGSRLFVSLSHVNYLRDRPEYQRRRAAKAQSKIQNPESEIERMDYPYEWGMGVMDLTGANAAQDHGEYYSAAQVAQLLGVSVQAVHQLRTRGRLEGHRIGRDRKGRSGRYKWWFYRKDDVHALQADPTYCKSHRRWTTVQRRNAGLDM